MSLASSEQPERGLGRALGVLAGTGADSSVVSAISTLAIGMSSMRDIVEKPGGRRIPGETAELLDLYAAELTLMAEQVRRRQ